MTTMLHIDWTRCDGRGLCTELLEGTLDRDEWGYPRALGYGSSVPIARERADDAADAIALCPRQALSVRRSA